MIRKQIYLKEDMNGKINEIAASKGVPQSEVIREGLELYLKSYEEKDKDWDELLHRMKQSEMKIAKWDREEIYSNRMERKHSNREHDQSNH